MNRWSRRCSMLVVVAIAGCMQTKYRQYTAPPPWQSAAPADCPPIPDSLPDSFSLRLLRTWALYKQGTSIEISPLGGQRFGLRVVDTTVQGEPFQPYDTGAATVMRNITIDRTELAPIYEIIRRHRFFCMPDSCIQHSTLDGGAHSIEVRIDARIKRHLDVNCNSDAIQELTTALELFR